MGKPKEGKLSVVWSKRENDFVVNYPRRGDGGYALDHLVGNILRFDPTKHAGNEVPFETENFIKELERRGYDPKTMQFSIELKKEATK